MHKEFIAAVNSELTHILDYWKKNSIDKVYGGFHGRIDHFNKVVEKSPKGVILNTRILWTFSAASNYFGDNRYCDECERAYNYLRNYFRDTTYKGVYWQLSYSGKPTLTGKQVYAQAFAIYALAEYYKYSKNQEALSWAIELFQLLETKAYDTGFQGYIEAFREDWKLVADMRLSEKDLNAPKTMNTHLHILEAYTTLYEVSGNTEVGNALNRLIHLFLERFISENNHFKLFFSRHWTSLSDEASFGHDIEAVWLMGHASAILGDSDLIGKTGELTVKVARTFLDRALDKDFGVFNAVDLKTGKIDTDKHWWPQIEAVVGLIYTWEITSEDIYLDTAKKIWGFITDKIIDHSKGEWYFRVDRQGNPYTNENKIGPWKGPYHNGRGCIQIADRLKITTA